ncbi:MAG: hypothetical protein ABW184_17380 [Sphingobium sp.]
MMRFETEAAHLLRDLASRVGSVEPGANSHYEVDLATLSDDRKKPLRADIELNLNLSQAAIYSISLHDAAPELVHESMTAARDAGVDQRCYCPILPLPHHPGTVLYVGSSRNLHKCLMEHLGFGAKKVYALHLRHWAGPFGRVRIDVRFYPPSTPKPVLTALEEHLASKLMPLFGLRGSL